MADHSYDSTGVKEFGERKNAIPEGRHKFRIVEAKPTKSAKGHFMVELIAEVVNNVDLMGRRTRHWVTFMPREHKGAGIAIHFLKVIGQPWEGKFDVTVSDWIGSEFIGTVQDQEYVSKKDGKTYSSSKIVDVNYVSVIPAENEIPF